MYMYMYQHASLNSTPYEFSEKPTVQESSTVHAGLAGRYMYLTELCVYADLAMFCMSGNE